MATSGSVNYADNRDETIKDALLDVGAIASEDTPAAHIVSHASRKLNRMLKQWQNYINLWKLKRVTLLLEKDKSEYSLGSTGDYACLTDDLNETAMRVAAVATDTTMECDSTTGMSAGDFVAVVMDDGNLHKTTVASVTDTDTFELTTGLTAAAAIDNAIYFFTTKINRPLSISKEDAFRRDSSNNDTPITIISREEYNKLGNKQNDGSIVQAYYDPQLTNGKLKVFNQSDSITDSLELTCQLPVEDMDSAADDFDYPQEWLLAIQTNLAVLLAPSYGVDIVQFRMLKDIAAEALDAALSWDTEKTSVFVRPANRMR